MTKKLIVPALLFFFLLILCTCSRSAETVLVEKTFDGPSFEYTMSLLEQHSQYNVYQLQYSTPTLDFVSDDQTVVAQLYLPNNWKSGDVPRRGIVCLDILSGDGALTSLFGARFANEGFPALLPVLPFIGQRSKERGGLKELAEHPDAIKRLGILFMQIHPELRRAIDLFVARPEVDDSNVNVIGISLGSIIACGLAAKDTRVDKIAILLPGGNIHKIVTQNSQDVRRLNEALGRASKEDTDFLSKALAEVEPLTFAKELRVLADANRIMMLNAEQDEVIPPECSTELAQAIGMAGKQRIFPGVGHYSAVSYLPEIISDVVGFFHDETIPQQQTKTFKRDGSDTLQMVAFDLLSLLNPDLTETEGFDFQADCVLLENLREKTQQGNLSKGLPLGSLQFAREGKKFFFGLNLAKNSPLGSEIGPLVFGQDLYPWLVSNSGKGFEGALNPSDKPLMSFLSKENRLALQMVVSVLQLLALEEAPATLRSTLGVRLEKSDSTPHFIQLEKSGFQARFQLTQEGNRLEQIKILDTKSGKGAQLNISRWEKMPPKEKQAFALSTTDRKEVDNLQMKRMLVAAIEAIIELIPEGVQ